MKVLVVGLNPSRKHGNSPTIKTLNKWLDVLELKMVSFINLYEGYEIDQRENQANNIREMCKDYDKVLALGKDVSDTLCHMEISHCRLAHPSGRNRQINNSLYVHEMLKACKNYLYGDTDEILGRFSNQQR